MKKRLTVLTSLFILVCGLAIKAEISTASVSIGKTFENFLIQKKKPNKIKKQKFMYGFFINKNLSIITDYNKKSVLYMNNGIALITEDKEKISGIFTHEALGNIWHKENLKLITTYYAAAYFPFGSSKGLFYAEWHKTTKDGIAAPIIFELNDERLIDENGDTWANGVYLLSDDEEILTKNQNYWKPE